MNSSPHPCLFAVSFLLVSLVCAIPATAADRTLAPASPAENSTVPDSLCGREFATIAGGPTSDKLRIDPAGSENAGNEIARFWQSSNSGRGNNFDGGCPSQSTEQGGGGWWELSQAPLRGLRAYLGEAGCAPSSCPEGPLTVLVEEFADDSWSNPYFIALQVDPTPSGNRYWDLARVDAAASPSVLPMQRFPDLVITHSHRVGLTIVVDFMIPDVAEGVHAVAVPGVDDPLPASAIVKSLDLYHHIGNWEPGRLSADWTLLQQILYEDGPVEGSFEVECPWPPGDDEQFSVGITFQGGDGPEIRSALVSGPLAIECGNPALPSYARGVLEYGPNPCSEPGGEVLIATNPCSGSSSWVSSSVVDLQQHLCEMVLVDGVELIPSAAFDCHSVAAYTVEPAQPNCLVQVRELSASPAPDGMLLEWAPLPCSDDYDVIRGSLEALSDGGLGDVLCIANDTQLLEALDATGQNPAPDGGFFYLVRSRGTVGSVHYGHTSTESPRLPAQGDCPID